MGDEITDLYRTETMPTTAPLPLAPRTALALCMLTAFSSSCSTKATPAPEKEPPPSTATAAPSPSAAVDRAVRPKEIPTLTAEKFTPGESHPREVYSIEGALMVVDGLRVGRIVEDRIEWIKTIPNANWHLGGTRISSVHGRWPDGIDVLYATNNGRAPQPTYLPLTGKGISHTVGGGGGTGFISGIATVGESTLVSGYATATGTQFMTVRGPGLVRRRLTPAEAGCKPEEISKVSYEPPPPAISPQGFVSTPSGTVISIGRLCQKRGMAAEVWDKTTGKSRIIDLSRWAKNADMLPKLMRGKGDELWVGLDSASPILHYVNDNFEPLPGVDKPFQDVFVSPSAELYASDGQTVYRFDDGKWIPIAHLPPWRYGGSALAIEKETLWMSWNESVYRLREDRGVVLQDGCKTPFVYLYDVSSQNGKDFTFPSTRKALSTFAGVADLSLVEFDEGGRRLGIKVPSKEQGEAVIAHLKASMKDEDPKLLCYEPKEPRKIEIMPKGK